MCYLCLLLTGGGYNSRHLPRHPPALTPPPLPASRRLAVECDCCHGRYACLHHAPALCECATSRRRLAYRHTLQQLDTILAEVAARVTPGSNSQDAIFRFDWFQTVKCRRVVSHDAMSRRQRAMLLQGVPEAGP